MAKCGNHQLFNSGPFERVELLPRVFAPQAPQARKVLGVAGVTLASRLDAHVATENSDLPEII